jgi:uncharacterized protein YdeI (YjbR/CyaY-like superfamily)
MPTPRNVQFFETAAELRKWFEANHDRVTELWLGYHRKRTGRPSVTWQEVVDVELCFGWIDSVRYSLDGDRSAQRITPRRKRSVWSNVNIKRFQELERQGLVHASGRAAFERRDAARSGVYSFENRDRGLDAAQRAEFQKHRKAWSFFEAQPPWYRGTAAHWAVSAKRPETRERRLSTLIECSRNGERIPPLRRASPRSPSRES